METVYINAHDPIIPSFTLTIRSDKERERERENMIGWEIYYKK